MYLLFSFSGPEERKTQPADLMTKSDIVALGVLGKPYSAHRLLQTELLQFPQSILNLVMQPVDLATSEKNNSAVSHASGK